MKNVNTLSAAFIATYPPRKCGIGTFTFDLVQSLNHLSEIGAVREDHLQIIAMNNIPEGYAFPPEANFVIREQYKSDYQEAAEFLNLSAVDVVSLQHEYGIFGGNDGNHIVHLLHHLKKPVVTTLHTVLDDPTPGQRETLRAIVSLSTTVVVLANKAVDILKKVYGIPEKQIVMIPHGAPDVPFLDTSYYKDHFQAEDRSVLLTFGLLNPNKGIEYVLNALPKIVRDYPDVLYIVLGATHPNVKREQGEQYRIHLERRVKELDLQQHVVFHNRFVTLEKLIQFLVATDIYITPYLSLEQISSGTLAYALTCGKAIVSTPYWYAEELLGDGRGILVPFRDSDAITKNVCALLADEAKLNRMRKNAYQWGRQMVWREVANRYDGVFEQAVTEFGRKKIAASVRRKAVNPPALPEIKLNHLQLLTDNTGIFQHAIYHTPNRFDGYTTDDNARALMVAVMHFEQFHEEGMIEPIHTYLGFLNHALNPKYQRFRNEMSYARDWLDEVGSEDNHGRVLWCLGYTIWQAPSTAILSLSNQLFKQGLKVCSDFSAPRAWAYSILGCLYYLQRFGGDTETNG
ncbi:MAG: glycosyltransferase family 4 protein, partial [bacterium]